MAQDVFGKEIRPGDICLVFDKAGRSSLLVAETVKPKTVDGCRSIGVLVINEEQARLHRFEANSWNVTVEKHLEGIQRHITKSRELKLKYGIDD